MQVELPGEVAAGETVGVRVIASGVPRVRRPLAGSGASLKNL